jgi:hypothetical protein
MNPSFEALVKSQFASPLAGGDEGEGTFYEFVIR